MNKIYKIWTKSTKIQHKIVIVVVEHKDKMKIHFLKQVVLFL